MMETARRPKWALVCHHCDTPSCVNPNHLYIGDHATNGVDKRSKRFSMSEVAMIEVLIKKNRITSKTSEPKMKTIKDVFKTSLMTLQRMSVASHWPCQDGVHEFHWSD